MILFFSGGESLYGESVDHALGRNHIMLTFAKVKESKGQLTNQRLLAIVRYRERKARRKKK